METNKQDFREIVKKIEEGKILLPDFQREFVWKDEEQQRKIVASVLAKMPIGSILLLKSKPDEYACKYIGCKKEVDTAGISGEVEFLLDGQQRMTVLTNVFSSVIHDKCDKVSDLVSPSLKRRFFLRIPTWGKCRDEKDLFGVHNLAFPISNAEEPDFLTGDILPFVEMIAFLNNDAKPYNPQVKFSTNIDTFCMSYKTGYLIPLYLAIPSENTKKNQIKLRYETIIEEVAAQIRSEINNHFCGLADGDKKDAFIDEIFEDADVSGEIKNDYSLFESKIREKEKLWRGDLKSYIESCIQNVSLNKIEVAEEQRARAIDIYENLNRGGVSLNTFDLIMARVAKVSSDKFYDRMVRYMLAEKHYKKELLPENIKKIIGKEIENHTYNATQRMRCYHVEKNEIEGKYIDAFLDVLSLYCYNVEMEPENFKLENIKRKRILELAPEQINDNCEKVCTALDRAMFFFQSRCGIRYISEINYALMIVLVATVFIRDEWFEDIYVHDKLEAWYWASVFSGEYDKDQNTKMISNLQQMMRTFQAPRSAAKTDWIAKLNNDVLNAQNFSDEEFLLMENAEDDRIPKMVMRMFMCQYLLSNTYADMFQPDKRLSAYDGDKEKFQIHHVIPLGTVTKVGESTAKLRKDEKHLCNSPLNFVYLTEQSNRDISDEPLGTYAGKICSEAKTALHISTYKDAKIDETAIKDILKERYSYLQGAIRDEIRQLIKGEE